jgi:hypothetical protein
MITRTLDIGARFIATEIKSGQTVAGDFFAHLEQLQGKLPRPHAERDIEARVVYGGSDRQQRREIAVIPWGRVKDLWWW